MFSSFPGHGYFVLYTTFFCFSPLLARTLVGTFIPEFTSSQKDTLMQTSFFCIRPHAFEHRQAIKQAIRDTGMEIIASTVTWLTLDDIRSMYGHEEPSAYFDASCHFMTRGFVEAGVVSGFNAIHRLVGLVGNSHIPQENARETLRARFGSSDPVALGGCKYYLNPMHRSTNQQEADIETAHYLYTLSKRSFIQTISNMMRQLHVDKDLLCVYDLHITKVVEIANQLCTNVGGDRLVVGLASWLHDIASLKSGDKTDHHIKGAQEAEDVLNLLGYEEHTIRMVKRCIMSHRGGGDEAALSLEEKIVRSADGMAHIRYPTLLFYFAYGMHGLSFEAGRRKVLEKINKSYKKIAAFAQDEVREEYESLVRLIG